MTQESKINLLTYNSDYVEYVSLDPSVLQETQSKLPNNLENYFKNNSPPFQLK